MTGGLTAPAEAPLSADEERLLQARLWALLGRQAALYTMGDSSSVPEQTARELAASLRYTLDKALEAERLPERALLSCDLAGLVRRGQAVLQEQTEQARALWLCVCRGAPEPDSEYRRRTLDGLGQYFRRYDLRFFAHRVPCSVDYPLLLPVPETLPGVDWVVQYLRQLRLENELQRRLGAEAVLRVLEAVYGDPGRDWLNLCEQPLVNAIGRALLHRPAGTLEITPADRAALLRVLPRGSAAQAAEAAARAVGEELGCTPALRRYLASCAGLLSPRLAAAAEHGELSHVFVSLRAAPR